jgi:hypothetical protein
MNPLSDPTYNFWIETEAGEYTQWSRLTKKQARDMHAYTEKNLPDNVKRFGWEEARPRIA